MNRPQKPITGTPLEEGYDAKCWQWMRDLEQQVSNFETRMNFRLRRVSGGGGGESESYEGPFAVVASGDDLVKVYSYNANEKRAWEALIYAGLDKIAVTETEISAASGSHVWIEITWSGSAYEYEVKSGASLPAPTSALYVAPLAYINDDKSITQLQFGNIYISGRVV